MKTTLTILRRIAGLACCGIFFCGCNQEEEPIRHEESLFPIAYTIPIALQDDGWYTPNSRGTDHTPTINTFKDAFSSGETIGVFADYYASEDAAPQLYISDQQVVKGDDGQWTYAPVRYWPNNNDLERLQFFAYWTDQNDPRITYNNNPQDPGLLYDAPDANIDVIAAMTAKLPHPADNVANRKTMIEFKHLLTKVNFTFTAASVNNETTSSYHPMVYMVRFEAPVKGSYNLRKQEWNLGENGLVTRFTDVQGIPIISNKQQIDDFTCLLLPGTKLTELEFDINNHIVSCPITKNIPIRAGEAINLNFTIDATTSHVFLATFSLWAEGGTINGKLE